MPPEPCLIHAPAPACCDELAALLAYLELEPRLASTAGELLSALAREPGSLVLLWAEAVLPAATIVAAIREQDALSPIIVVGGVEAPDDRLVLLRGCQAWDVVPPPPDGLAALSVAARAALRHRSRVLGRFPVAGAPAVLPDGGGPSLTARELELLRWVAEGLGNREVGRRLSISEHTVRNGLARIYNKLGVQSRTQALAVARRLRLV
ncbi:MAG: helix-turn-helix transcriptional regulator [Candidatus Sericytochromatia bacterium]|nr:helix-turn-helix transcriptional regulator [Candidatus Sericytochromatia bacterium]